MENQKYFVEIAEAAVSRLHGPESLDLVQRISTNDVSRLRAGEVIQTVFTNEKGRIVDIALLTREQAGDILVLGKGNVDALIAWIERFVIMEDILIADLSDDFKQFILFSSHGLEPAESAFSSGTTAWRFEEVIAGRRLVHVLVPTSSGLEFAKKLAGQGFRETNSEQFNEFRVMRGIPAYGSELSTAYNPLEAGLRQLISFTKGCYVGQEVVARLDTYKKVQRHLVRMSLGELPTSLPQTIFSDEKEAGEVTSAVKLRDSGEVKGLGYIRFDADGSLGTTYFRQADTRVNVAIELPHM